MSKRKLLSQNFLRDPNLVAKLIERSSIVKNDLVLEIGPGKGIITQGLLTKADQVIAVEIDPELCSFLRQKFTLSPNLILYERDFLNFSLPHGPYKVFANIPFSLEGQIVRMLLDSPNPPTDSYLVVVKSLALRLSGITGDNQFSLTHKPWFDFSIVHAFNRHDFTPAPSIPSVLWRFIKKDMPLLPWSKRSAYSKFISLGFKNGLPVSKNLCEAFLKVSVAKAISDLGVSKTARPTELSQEKWLKLFKTLTTQV